jgi:hypothetical protein
VRLAPSPRQRRPGWGYVRGRRVGSQIERCAGAGNHDSGRAGPQITPDPDRGALPDDTRRLKITEKPGRVGIADPIGHGLGQPAGATGAELHTTHVHQVADLHAIYSYRLKIQTASSHVLRHDSRLQPSRCDASGLGLGPDQPGGTAQGDVPRGRGSVKLGAAPTRAAGHQAQTNNRVFRQGPAPG